MVRKPEKLTPRQRQSQRIMRQKAAQRKRRLLMKRIGLVAGGVCCLVLAGGSFWIWKSGAIGRAVQNTVDGAYGLTAKAGFAVHALYLEGRNRTSMAEIDKALDIKKGDPILSLSLDEVRERLEKVESVKFAAVERELPGTLYVRIVEREPVALWQNDGKLALVDDNGVVMTGIDSAPYRQLPLIVGDDAPAHVDELMAILASEPELARRFNAAVRVGGRRWNIRLSKPEGGIIEVQLPESDPAAAWKKLAGLQAHQQLLDRDVKVIDLRLEDRLFIRQAPQSAPGRTANARDT